MNKLPFLQELTEARLFTDAKTVSGKSVDDIASIVYLMIMMLEIIRHTNHSFAADYANKTMAFSTYENMHYAGTDLGNLLAVLNNQDTFKGYITPTKGVSIPLFQINRYLSACKGTTFNHNEDAQFFYRLEDYLKLYSKSNFRQFRRDIGDWAKLSYVERNQIVLKLRQEFDKRASSSDMYIWFKQQFKLKESINYPASRVVYHTSNSANRDSILKAGLVPQNVEHSNIARTPGVYVFNTLLHAADWAFWDSLHKKVPIDIWKISLPGSYILKKDTYPDMKEFDAYVSHENIPAEWIELVKEQPVPKSVKDAPPYAKLSESRSALDSDYYLTEGCGIFALALAEFNPASSIYIFSNNNGEKWSDRIPYEVTHVVTAIDGEIYDVTGRTSKIQVDQQFNLAGNYTIKGPFLPSEFAKKFVGSNDTKPLYGRKSDIDEAKKIINFLPDKYNLTLRSENLQELATSAIKPEDINTKLGYHSKLNPALWYDNELIQDVKDALAKIANKFSEFIDVKQMKIVDYIITGSNCAFNYTEDSDIDIHVLIDASKLGENPLTSPFLLAKKALWNSGHNITVKGYDVELYAEDINDQENKLVATGVYSLLQDRWIKQPEYVPVQYDDASVQSKAADIMNQIDELIATGEPDQVQIDKLWNHIYKMRRAGLAKSGEFDVSNLAFKVIRNYGYLTKLRDFERMREDEDLTLEGKIIY